MKFMNSIGQHAPRIAGGLARKIIVWLDKTEAIGRLMESSLPVYFRIESQNEIGESFPYETLVVNVTIVIFDRICLDFI